MTEMMMTPQQHAPGGVMAIPVSREMEEVRAQIFLAHQFPRDMVRVEAKLQYACAEPELAKAACYEYPKGEGNVVTGPSIRLAEAIMQAFGNATFGVRELQQADGKSVMQAFVWDAESNLRSEKTFTVPHVRATKQSTYALTDPRDVYEVVASQGSRRLRACILSLVPRQLVTKSVAWCDDTLMKLDAVDVKRSVANMLEAFKKFGVTEAHLEKKLGHRFEVCTPDSVLRMRKIFNSIRDGYAKVGDHFEDLAKPAQGAAAAELNQRFGAQEARK